jgi:uncharacterized protein (DUF1778 family)
MATSSLTHNFVINDAESAERFAEALDKPKISKSNIKVKRVTGAENARLLVEKWKKSTK